MGQPEMVAVQVADPLELELLQQTQTWMLLQFQISCTTLQVKPEYSELMVDIISSVGFSTVSAFSTSSSFPDVSTSASAFSTFASFSAVAVFTSSFCVVC